METGGTGGPEIHIEHEEMRSGHVTNGDIPQAVYGEVRKKGGFRRDDHENDFVGRREFRFFECGFDMGELCGVDQ